MVSQTEENYLKALFHLTYETENKSEAGTNELATYLEVKPATANDMLKKLKDKGLVSYEKYGKITLTNKGSNIAIEIVRKHRLWETFLYEKMNFTWDEVHEVAEQLEHIKSQKLVEQLERFLDFPEIDPHGDPIPNARGEVRKIVRKSLSEICIGDVCKLVAVKDGSVAFLQYVAKLGLGLSTKIKVVSRQEFDGSMEIEVNNQHFTVSQKFANNLYVV
ncbi:MAG TPA: metal-dependent transcriptional regulator [Saprospiraceae bacterium]|jgi:DtxR family Mn-dependent transcriptional regulator|nr:metal-dependent transcriptional regulator [Candidatus Parvibacillus calidus]HQN56327.1 metal-dependent transcriptional regulator [Saprospiraceae bacterium]HQP77272.1 metal-dependent transcriptional regulator [Saprospiraceae bacterium]HRN34154.1 metal-dependent transcriptional regulator [Saprospiraceae bacterium]HRP84966.1 metal-dependent transcriptional regulator [Saprospiraceae bacterium]